MGHNRRQKWINQQREVAAAVAPLATQPPPPLSVGYQAVFTALYRYFDVDMRSDNRGNVDELVAALKLAAGK